MGDLYQIQPNQVPAFKSGDLVRSKVELTVDHASRRISHLIGLDPTNPHRPLYREVLIDSTTVKGLVVRQGVLLLVDAVLPWGDENDLHPQRYRLELTTFPDSSLLDDTPHALTQREVDNLRLVLGHPAEAVAFSLYAGEAALELVTSIDEREPGSPFLNLWEDDSMFPWSVTLVFPATDDLLKYAVDAYVGEDNGDDDAQGYFLSLHPLFLRNPVKNRC